MKPLLISGNDLQLDDVVEVAHGRSVALDPAALPRIERSRAAVEQLVAEGRAVYGITTGFGRFKDRIISADQTRQLQLNLVRSHAVGVGPDLSEQTVRAMLVVRVNTLAKGFSGVRPKLIQLLLDMLNGGVCPCIPSQGSLGASGDLAPLAHLALVVIGEGEATVNGERLAGGEALARAGLQPITLEAKEGLALLNGTAQMVGMGALLVRRAVNLMLTADAVACLSLEALHGTDRAFDERVHALRPHPRQIDCARFLRRLLEGSRLVRQDDPMNVQDPYTLRCIPQVHGAIRDAIAYLRWVIDIELNSVNDNPIILVEETERLGDSETEENLPISQSPNLQSPVSSLQSPISNSQIDVISAGNFHGEPIALAMDYAGLALTELGNISERRSARLVDADSNGGVLPMFLTAQGGLESGFMMAHYTAAALASENKVLAHPASADTIPTSANVEDHVSMGATAARQAEQILNHVETIVAIELLLAGQGIDFRCRETGADASCLGAGTAVVYQLLREKVPFLEEDTVLAPHMEAARQLVVSGVIKHSVEQRLGME